MFCSQDIQVFVFLTIPWFKKSVMSQWVHETRWIFEYTVWIATDYITKLWKLIDIRAIILRNLLDYLEEKVIKILSYRMSKPSWGILENFLSVVYIFTIQDHESLLQAENL